ncbi:MAG: hypothetical protein ACOH2F_06035 [Cellulomonas sp.]
MTLPTPFTADEIRSGCPDGRTVRTRDEEGTVAVSRYVDGDVDGATLESWTEAPDGTPPSEHARTRVTWHQLQQHAAFPTDGTIVREEAIMTPLGELECARYDVGDLTFWFDLHRPGMPVRYGRAGSMTTMIADRRE